MVSLPFLLGVYGERGERRRSGEDRGNPVEANLPDEVGEGVGDEGVAGEIDGDIVRVVFAGGEEGEEETITGAEVVGGEGVEEGEGDNGVNDLEEAVARAIDDDAEDGGVGEQGVVADEVFDDIGVRDGMDGVASKGADEEVLGRGFPGHGFWVEARGSEGDGVGLLGVRELKMRMEQKQQEQEEEVESGDYGSIGGQFDSIKSEMGNDLMGEFWVWFVVKRMIDRLVGD